MDAVNLVVGYKRLSKATDKGSWSRAHHMELGLHGYCDPLNNLIQLFALSSDDFILEHFITGHLNSVHAFS